MKVERVCLVAVVSRAANSLGLEECPMLLGAEVALFVPRLRRGHIPSALLLLTFSRLNKNFNLISCCQITQHLLEPRSEGICKSFKNKLRVEDQNRDSRPLHLKKTVRDHSEPNKCCLAANEEPNVSLKNERSIAKKHIGHRNRLVHILAGIKAIKQKCSGGSSTIIGNKCKTFQ